GRTESPGETTSRKRVNDRAEAGHPRAGCVAQHRRKSQPPATEGERARYAAPDGRDAASGAAADRAAWRRARVKWRCPSRVDRAWTQLATRRLDPGPIRPRRAMRPAGAPSAAPSASAL